MVTHADADFLRSYHRPNFWVQTHSPCTIDGTCEVVCVTDLPGPPSVQANSKKIDTLKRRAWEIARDRRS
jgi:hypothetical protein